MIPSLRAKQIHSISLIGASLGVVLLSFFYLQDLVIYWSCQNIAPIERVELKILRKGVERFYFQAHYGYKVGEKLFEKKEILKQYPAKNPWVLESKKEEVEKSLQKVWYSSKRPSKSTLSKSFPLKSGIVFSLLFLLGLYFWFFSRYLIKRF